MKKARNQVLESGDIIKNRIKQAIERPSKREGVSLELLETMLCKIDAITNADQSQLPPIRVRNLSRMIVDSWPLGTDLGNAISDWETLYVDFWSKMKIPTSCEVQIIGRWLEKTDGSVEADENCERIDWLTKSIFELVKVDGDNWAALYKNPNDDKYWELTYPQSHMHGGGPPSLTAIDDHIAFEKNNIKTTTAQKRGQ